MASSLIKGNRCAGCVVSILLLLLSVCCEGRLRYENKEVVSSLSNNVRQLQSAEELFINLCQASIDEAANDDIISESDYVNFLLSQCNGDNDPEYCAENGNTSLTFSELPLEYQFRFVLFVCDNANDRSDCENSLKNDASFGLNVTEAPNLDNETEKLCSDIFQYGGGGQIPAPSTSTPTAATPAPTPSPTVPTQSPTTPSGIPGGANKSIEVDDSLGGGAIAGISIAAALVILLGVFLVGRKRRDNGPRRKTEEELQNDELVEIEGDDNIVEGEESIMTENSKDIYLETQTPVTGSGVKSGDTNRGMEVVSMDVLNDSPAAANEPISADPQFSKAATAGVATGIAAGITAAAAVGASTKSREEGESRGHKLDSLDSAIDSGNWEAAYQIASALSSDNEASSRSSRGSTPSSNRSSTRSLSAEDQALAEKLDELIDKGDFDAVAHLTKQYSEKSKENEEDAEERRSIFDMLSGKKVKPSEAAGAGAASGAAAAALIAAAASESSDFSEQDEDSSKQGSKKGNWAGLFNRSGKYEYMVDNMGSETESETGGEVAYLTAAGVHGLAKGSTASGSVSGSASMSGKESPISSSRSTPIDPDMVQDFEKLIEANDWEGLAALAGEGAVPKETSSAEQDRDGPMSPDEVMLRKVSKEPRSPPTSEVNPPKKQRSLHGAKVLIPYWEKELEEKEKKASLGQLDDEKEEDLDNALLLGEKGKGTTKDE